MPDRPPALGRLRRPASGRSGGVPRRAPKTGRLVALVLGLTAVGVIAAALSGWWAGGAASPEPTVVPLTSRDATAGPVRLEVTGDWRPVPRVPGLAGLPAATAAFTPAAGLRAFTVITFTPSDHPSLLPPALRALMPEPLPKPRKTELAGHPAWLYDEVPVSQGRLLEVTLVPSTAGTLAIACIAPRAAWVAALGCAGNIRRLSLKRGEAWLRPAADVATRARIPATVAKLDSRRVTLRARLKDARTGLAQARFASRLAEAYATAATTLAAVAPPKGPTTRIVADMRRSSAAYRKLAAAAAAGRPNRYKRAKRAAKRSEARLKADLRKLGE